MIRIRRSVKCIRMASFLRSQFPLARHGGLLAIDRGRAGLCRAWTVSRSKTRDHRGGGGAGSRGSRARGKSFSALEASSVSNGGAVAPKEVSQLFKPVAVVPNQDDINLGEEIAGKISKQALLRQLNTFYLRQEIRELAKEQGLDDYLYHQAYISFRKFCMDVNHLPTDLYVLFSDILKYVLKFLFYRVRMTLKVRPLFRGQTHNTDLFPFFLRHARKVFPHLECLDELKSLSDLTDPPNWYPEARNMTRRVVFHAGPTNSGKTYHALERFMSAKSGVYCGPLKLLAAEVFNKCKARGVDCDLVTGEERRSAREDGEPADHVACTVEMTNCNQTYEVAVIDEIQMVKDYQRGWAWTRALLGVPAEEIHVCGEVLFFISLKN